MTNQERFLEIYNTNIRREGAAKFLEFLQSRHSDFFSAPASTRYHLSSPGGLLQHSLNVYDCLVDYLNRPRVKETYHLQYSEETIAIVGLLHDVCKINTYQPSTRNVKNASGQWQTVPSYQYQDEIPYGHGEKSVYIISGYMRLSREEAFAIRYHMGFSGTEENRLVGEAFRRFPLAFALATADMEATYLLEGES